MVKRVTDHVLMMFYFVGLFRLLLLNLYMPMTFFYIRFCSGLQLIRAFILITFSNFAVPYKRVADTNYRFVCLADAVFLGYFLGLQIIKVSLLRMQHSVSLNSRSTTEPLASTML